MSGRKYSQEEKEKYIQEFMTSNESQKAYAETRGIPESTFRGWLKYQNENNIEFGNIDIVETDDIVLSVKCQNISIELKKGFDTKLLKKIMEVVVDD